MWGGPCRTCEAKDTEIAHLLALLDKANAQVEKAQARMSELLEPGLNQRLEAPRRPMPVRPTPDPAQGIGFPGYAPGPRAVPKIEVEG